MEVDRAEQHHVVERFLAALATGDLQGLLDVLAPDVAMIADGGGLAAAIRAPLSGVDVVSRVLAKFAQRSPEGTLAVPMWLNGAPAARIDIDGTIDTAISLAIENGRITRIYAVRNPHKLARLGEATVLSRGGHGAG